MARENVARSNTLTGIRPDGIQVAVRDMVRADLPTAAVISKLTESQRRPAYTDKGELKIETPSVSHLRDRASQLAENQRDAENILATMPDIEMMASLLISSIISPHDMITKEVVVTSNYDLIDNTLKSELISITKKYFDTDYRIKDHIQSIIEDILVHDGSHPLLVLPENAIDELINGRSNFSSESLVEAGLFNKKDRTLKPLGILCNPYAVDEDDNRFDPLSGKFSLESITQEVDNYNVYSKVRVTGDVEINLRVIDNFNILKLPGIIQAKKEYATSKALERGMQRNSNFVTSISPDEVDLKISNSPFSIESIDGKGLEAFDDLFSGSNMSDRSIRSLVYKSRHKTNDTIRVVRTQDQLTRRSIGEPLILKLPAESFIPVFIPGQESRQVGAFVLLDNSGNFITRETLKDFRGSFQMNPAVNKNFASVLLERVKSNYVGNFDCNNPVHQQELVDAYVQVVEADFIARLRNAIHGNSARIATNQEVYRIMLMRHLAGNMTQALWIPRELFTYFAFDHNNVGIGRSILDKIKVLSSIRAIVTMANVKASIRNSIGETIVEVQFDPRDPDPKKTQEMIMDMMMRTRQESMPIGVQNPADITEWLAKAGIRFAWGGHQGMPEMTIETRQEALQYVKPDTDLLDYLEKVIAKAFSLTPEQIDNIHQPDHATTIVQNNILFAKRVINYQDKFNPQLTDHCRKVMRFSQNLYESIINTIAKNFDSIDLTEELRDRCVKYPDAKKMIIEMVSKDFIESVLFELPKPKNIRVQNQIDEIQSIEELSEKITENYFSESMFNKDIVGELGDGFLENVKGSVKSFLIRKYMSDSGMMNELSGLFTDKFSDSDFKALFEEQSRIIHTTSAAYLNHISNNKEFKAKLEKASEVMDIAKDASSLDQSENSSSDLTFGDDDLGMDDNFTDLEEVETQPEQTEMQEEQIQEERDLPENPVF